MHGETLHTIQEAALVLRLHPKTVLRFITEKRIPARKIGRNWMMSGQDLEAFAGTGKSGLPVVATRGMQPGQGPLPQDEPPSIPGRNSSSATMRVHNQTLESAQRLSTTLMAMANSKEPEDGEAMVDISWHPAGRTCTVRLKGSPKVVATLLSAAASLED